MVVLLLIVGAVAAAAWWFHRKTAAASPAGGRGANAAVPVVAASARQGNLDIYLTGLGSVTPFNTVTIRSRVDGQIDTVAFTEGQHVKAGDLLVQIDPRPYQVMLEQAEGQMLKDKAVLANAQSNVNRDKQAQIAISAQQLDTDEATASQAQGAVQIDQGAIDSAKLELTYCRITSPIAGKIGLRLIDPGNIIHAADTTGMAVITQLKPISVIFTLPEDNLPEVRGRIAAGGDVVVQAWDRDLKNQLAVGKLLAIDNQIDVNSGTFKIKAEFANEGEALFPNQFVNARLRVRTIADATLIPTAAVQHGTQATFVYRVEKDDDGKQIVKAVDVTVGAVEGDQGVCESGVEPGDVLVVDGVDKLQDGTKVEVRRAERKGAAASPTSAPASRPAGAGTGSATTRRSGGRRHRTAD